jgi:hypothetical protein
MPASYHAARIRGEELRVLLWRIFTFSGKNPQALYFLLFPLKTRSRADWIRTSDLLNPINKRAFLAQFGRVRHTPEQSGF